MIYRNPQNGHTEEVNGMTPIWAFLFGWIYLAVRGMWAHIAIQLLIIVAAAATGLPGLAFVAAIVLWLVYGFATPAILDNRYRHAGWQAVDEVGWNYLRPKGESEKLPSSSVESDGGSQLTMPVKSEMPAHSIASELAKFADLRDRGILTEDEFNAQKARLLAQRL